MRNIETELVEIQNSNLRREFLSFPKRLKECERISDGQIYNILLKKKIRGCGTCILVKIDLIILIP